MSFLGAHIALRRLTQPSAQSYSIQRYARKIHGRVLGQFEEGKIWIILIPLLPYSRELPSRTPIPLSLCYPGHSRGV